MEKNLEKTKSTFLNREIRVAYNLLWLSQYRKEQYCNGYSEDGDELAWQQHPPKSSNPDQRNTRNISRSMATIPWSQFLNPLMTRFFVNYARTDTESTIRLARMNGQNEFQTEFMN